MQKRHEEAEYETQNAMEVMPEYETFSMTKSSQTKYESMLKEAKVEMAAFLMREKIMDQVSSMALIYYF